MHEQIIYRKAFQSDLPAVHEMMKDYFQLERRTYDSSLSVYWAVSQKGKKYLRSRMKHQNHLF